MYTLLVNGRSHTVDGDGDTPLLWALRDDLALTGTRFGCGIGLCGACTVLRDGQPIRSCTTTIEAIGDSEITTIEGLPADASHPVQRAWIEEDIAQCGYCQPGQIMSAVGLLAENSDPSDSDIDRAMNGNVCRCGTYRQIRDAIRRVAREATGE